MFLIILVKVSRIVGSTYAHTSTNALRQSSSAEKGPMLSTYAVKIA